MVNWKQAAIDGLDPVDFQSFSPGIEESALALLCYINIICDL